MWDVRKHTSTGRVNLSEFIKEALDTLVPKNAQRDTVQVIIPESATGHLVSGTTTVLIKFWVPEDIDNSIMASGDVVLNRAPDLEPFDHESGGPNITAAGDAQGKFDPEESGYSDKG